MQQSVTRHRRATEHNALRRFRRSPRRQEGACGGHDAGICVCRPAAVVPARGFVSSKLGLRLAEPIGGQFGST